MDNACHAYDSEFIQDEDINELHLWCLDRKNNPVHLIVKDTPNYMYIELPKNDCVTKWDHDSVNKLLENFTKSFGKVAPTAIEYIEKEKLYYYKGEVTQMAKLYFNSPRDMNICAYKLTKTNSYKDFGELAFKVYEKDISIRRKVATITGTRYCQWFTFKGKEILFEDDERQAIKGTDSRPIKEFVIESFTDITPIDNTITASWQSNPKIFSWDIETYSDNHHSMPDKTNSNHVIYMISCLSQITGDKSTREKYVIVKGKINPIEGVKIFECEDEEQLLVTFLELIDYVDPEIIIGYNIFAYDYPYFDARFNMYRESYEPCSRLQGRIPDMTEFKWDSGAYGQNVISYLKLPGRISIDLFPLIKRDYKFDKYTLDFVSGELLGAGKHDVTAQQMFAAYESKDINEMTRVTRYCIQDSDLVIDLYEKMQVWIGLVEMANIVGVEIMELFTRGQQIRCLSQIYDLTSRKNFVINSRDLVKLDYKGGFVGEPIKGLHENVICLDFSSLYPSIMMAYNICYTTLIPEMYIDEFDPECVNTIIVDDNTRYHFIKDTIRKGILPQLVENLVKERTNVRKEIKVLSDKLKKLRLENNLAEIKQTQLTLIVLDKRQLALKVSANSMYGFLGVQENGKLPLIEGAVCITAMGRQLINQVNEYLIEKYNATIIYNDTDSSMVTIPQIKDPKEVNTWGKKLAEEISGTPEVRSSDGTLVTPEVRGLFPPPLKMEFEKGMRFIGITKKKYAAFLIDGKGEFKKDRNGEEEIYKRGIVIARRDNFPYLRKKYTEILRGILRKNSIEVTFKAILDGILDILSGELPIKGNFTIIRGLGKDYKADGFFMKVFADELSRMQHPVSAGDRLEYIVVEGDPKLPLGKKMRLIEMYNDALNYDESVEGPRPDNVYPVERLDYMYYLEKGFQNPIDQLFSAGYIEELYGTTLHESGYTPQNSAAHPVSICTPVKLVTAMIKDKLKQKLTIKECIEYLRNDFYDWFLTELSKSKKIVLDIKAIETVDSDSDEFL